MENVSTTFRQNCYDDTKRQRILLMSDSACFSNEHISANSKVKFNIASCNRTDQIQFGCTPTNSVSVSILNEDGSITSDVIAGQEYACHIGVEVDDGEYLAPSSAISAVNTPNESISVHSEAPYIRGNVSLADHLSELEEGNKCKIVLIRDILYFVVDDGTDRYYARHDRIGLFAFGEYSTPSDTEKSMLDRIMDVSTFDGIAYYDGGMTEFTCVGEPVIPGEWHTVSGSVITVTDALAYPIKSWVVGIGMTPTSSGGGDEPAVRSSWTDMLSNTWGGVSSATWGEYSGYTVFSTVHYESVPFGVWHFDRPRKVNSAVLTLSGKDRMTMFDEDSITFVGTIPSGKMFTIREYINAIAAYSGVPVGDLTGLNELVDEIRIDGSVYYQGKSLKDILSYAFEVGGANCMIDRRGWLCASNADNEPVVLPYVYTFDVADYTSHTIGSMLVYRQGEYVQYEDDPTVIDGVPYDWQDNPFFNNMLLSGSWFSNEVNKKYGGFRNAVTVSDADFSLWSDDVYSWTDDEGTFIEPIFTMSVEWGGFGRVTYTNYGDETRKLASYSSRVGAVSSVNDKNLQGLNKAQYADRLYFDEEGLTIQSKGMRILNQAQETVLSADDEGNLKMKGKVEADSGYIGRWEIVEDGIKCGWETDYVFLGYDPDGNVPSFMSSMAWGVTPEGENICKSTIEGAHIYFESFLGDQTIASSSIGLDDNTGDIAVNSPIVMRNVGTTAQSANTALISIDAYGLRRFYVVSSLRKFKDNIKTIENASERVDNLRGVSFTSKCEGDDPNTVLYGLIAEEVEKACPELASYSNGELQGVQYDRVCALLIEDNKACHRRIEALEKRLEELERRLDK